ncbi:hypothetical protein T08_12839 [Trichinella sp. T8]|nr:hypothetical protein T08_12839 [Trichinella sp. T8]
MYYFDISIFFPLFNLYSCWLPIRAGSCCIYFDISYERIIEVDRAAMLTRLHDELNRHFLDLKSFGKNVNSGRRKKLRCGTLTEWRGFIRDRRMLR